MRRLVTDRVAFDPGLVETFFVSQKLIGEYVQHRGRCRPRQFRTVCFGTRSARPMTWACEARLSWRALSLGGNLAADVLSPPRVSKKRSQRADLLRPLVSEHPTGGGLGEGVSQSRFLHSGERNQATGLRIVPS